MNVVAAGMVGIALLEHGGLSAGGDVRTLLSAYRAYQGGQIKLQALLTDANLAAAERVINALAGVVQVPAERAELVALVQSL